MSSSREEGWLETKIGRAEHWERMWFVFDDGVLFYSSYREADRDDSEAVTRVPMDRVISLRTDVSTDQRDCTHVFTLLSFNYLKLLVVYVHRINTETQLFKL